MSTGGGLLCCLLLLLQVCVAQEASLISSSQLTGGRGQIGGDDVDDLLVQDPIRRSRVMSIHGSGSSADSISDDGVDDYTSHEYARVNRCLLVAGRGRVVGDDDEKEEGLMLPPPDGDDDGGDSLGTTKGSSGSGGDVECPECGKFFRNNKSMFGHLRSHPNRGYKGAIPPVKKVKLWPEMVSAASSSSPAVTDPTAPALRTNGRDPELTPLEVLCACVLLTLKYREHDTNDTTQVPPQSLSFEKLDDAIGQAQEVAGTGGGSVVAGNNASAELQCNNTGAEAAGILENCDEHDGNSILKIPRKRRNMIPKEVRKKAKLIVLPTPKEKRPYACKHCKAEFPTNQALGGHVAGHHREKKVPRLSDPSAAMAAESQNGKQRVNGGGGDYDDNKDLSLRRGLLSEQFSMALDVPSWQSAGQQVSGVKMRRHHGRRNDDGLSMATVTAPTPTRVDGGGGSARRPWNIDLNVKAPEQE